jgi:hypothetical protein
LKVEGVARSGELVRGGSVRVMSQHAGSCMHDILDEKAREASNTASVRRREAAAEIKTIGRPIVVLTGKNAMPKAFRKGEGL